VDDLWEKHLPHLREEIIAGEGLFVFNIDTGYYGFQEGDCEDNATNDELAVSLDREEVQEEKPDIPVPGNYNNHVDRMARLTR
jgi:hypothetical protein